MSQSTQALVTGRVTDQLTGKAVPDAWVAYENRATNTSGKQQADVRGFYALPLLPPGIYSITSGADNYQPRRYDSLSVAVAAALNLDFALRRITDIFDHNLFRSVPTGKLLSFYGPDVDTSRAVLVQAPDVGEGRIDSGLSDVIDPTQIEALPLTGRDVYTALLLQPGVTADPTATRGLGFSVNGQRPSSSSFLLDGVESDNYLISGPLLTPAPEAIQEYRLSTANFSAEYGGTSGYIANAITRTGGPEWKGTAYFVAMNSALDANGFQENFNGYPRPPLKQFEPGFEGGGPVWRRLIFTSDSLEYLSLRTRSDPQTYLLPTSATFANPGTTESGTLLRQYAAAAAPAGPAGTAQPLDLTAPNTLNQLLALSRFDGQTRNSHHHFFLRTAISQYDRPDFYWTPYADFVGGFQQHDLNVAAGATDNLSARVVSEARVAWERDVLSVADNNHGLPRLSTCAADILCLPSSTSPFAYRNSGHAWQALDNVSLVRGKHAAKFGMGFLLRDLDAYLRNGADGSYSFQSLGDFLNDNPYAYSISVARQANPQAPLALPNFDRSYRYEEVSFFAQDSWKLTGRLALNYGLRYEYLGAPVNTGAQKDVLIQLGPGDNMPQTLAGAQFVYSSSGSQPLYHSDPHDWAPRFGFSWLPWRDSPVLIRGSYGIFYDRPFDNLWQTIQNNSIVFASTALTSGPIPYLTMAQAGLPSFPNLSLNPEQYQPTLFQPGLRNAMTQSAFTGIQSRISEIVALELNAQASRGRGVLTTDFINRDYSVPIGATNLFGRFQPALPPISYRANQGSSDYDALTALVRLHTKKFQGQVAYTWSHAIDNQSDPIAGDSSLQFANVAAGGSYYGRAAFVQQFNSGADRGNADFDQRQSLVFFAIANIPAPSGRGWLYTLARNWQVAGLGSLRSGLPFNAYAILPPVPLENQALIDDRADLVDPAHAYLRQTIPGGAQILNPAAFATPADGAIGNVGRNAFAGPGTISADFSVSRTFPLPGESRILTIRADAYNIFNHPNLYVDGENPVIGTPQFGTAQYGTTGVQTTLPVQIPLAAIPRQIQLQLRLQF
jgi:hypothetical protein